MYLDSMNLPSLKKKKKKKSIRKYEFRVSIGAQAIAGVLPYIFVNPCFRILPAWDEYPQ